MCSQPGSGTGRMGIIFPSRDALRLFEITIVARRLVILHDGMSQNLQHDRYHCYYGSTTKGSAYNITIWESRRNGFSILKLVLWSGDGPAPTYIQYYKFMIM
jgi:hypothetical protein